MIGVTVSVMVVEFGGSSRLFGNKFGQVFTQCGHVVPVVQEAGAELSVGRIRRITAMPFTDNVLTGGALARMTGVGC